MEGFMQVDEKSRIPNLGFIQTLLSDQQEELDKIDQERRNRIININGWTSRMLQDTLKHTCFIWNSDGEKLCTLVEDISVDETNVIVWGKSITFVNDYPVAVNEHDIAYFDPTTFHTDITPVTRHHFDEWYAKIDK